jgi:alkylation response protein AidB-like acyl-CoA dehydrogenase
VAVEPAAEAPAHRSDEAAEIAKLGFGKRADPPLAEELLEERTLEPQEADIALDAARRLAPMIAAAGDAIEAARRLTPEVVDALHAAGLYRLLLPRDFGGAELDLADFSLVIEAIAGASGDFT